MTNPETAETAPGSIDLRLSESELESTRQHIVGFIREQVTAAGGNGAVLGLSGGVDSTLIAFLAVEALGVDGLYGLVMPSEVNSEENMSDAERVAKHLEIDYDVVEIGPIVDAFVAAFPRVESDQLTIGNARVRTRAVLNYMAANHMDRLVLGTGNRSEALVGYYTKYGDGAVDCHPIGALYKQQVRQLARYVGAPEDLAAKTATAEMWTGQTDEEEMGMDYDTLDAILALHVDGPLSTSATVRELPGVTEVDVQRVDAMHAESEHKRRVPPSPDPL